MKFATFPRILRRRLPEYKMGRQLFGELFFLRLGIFFLILVWRGFPFIFLGFQLFSLVCLVFHWFPFLFLTWLSLNFLHFLCFCHWCSLFFCWFSCILLTFLCFSLAFLAFPLACPACSSFFPICSWILLALLFVLLHFH